MFKPSIGKIEMPGASVMLGPMSNSPVLLTT
jgi:hypothetical protein